MTEKLIPDDAQRAAKRGFIRSTSQAYAATLTLGVTVAGVTDVVTQAQSGDPLPLIITAAVAVVAPVISGAASYFSILASGIPADYRPEQGSFDGDGYRA